MDTGFDPILAVKSRHTLSWVDWEGDPCHPPGETHAFLSQQWIAEASSICKPTRDPNNFVAGQLNEHWPSWRVLLKNQHDGGDLSDRLADWIEHGVDIFPFFRSFKGNFQGRSYNCTVPPPTVFHNHRSCEIWGDEIARHLEERLRNGSLELVGRVGQVRPPTLVMPIVMVPGTKKNRLCHDERFLNLFMTKEPFKLETLASVPSLLSENDFITNCDEKSAYDGLLLTQQSRPYFGLQFGGWYMQYATLPFGWSLSPYIYQSTGMQITQFLRTQGVVMLQYLDDRLIGPHKQWLNFTSDPSPREATLAATKLSLAILSHLGYTIAISKSVLEPTQTLLFLGFNIHVNYRHFSIPQAKIDSFRTLRENILQAEEINLKSIQKLMGKCISFMHCVPNAKMYTRAMAASVALHSKSSQLVSITGDLKEEIGHWVFVDKCDKWLPWRQERHVDLTLATDASSFAWGAKFMDISISERWPTNDNRPIHLKEAEALLKTIQAVGHLVQNKRVDAMVDNMALCLGWEKERSRDPRLTNILKSLASLTISLNCDLHLKYIPSKDNPADAPSRRNSPQDAELASKLWHQVETLYGPHTFDLMALDSNAKRDAAGTPLPHYTPYPLPGSAGVNVLAQSLSSQENYYVFPPIPMIQPLLSFLLRECTRPLTVTMVVPMLTPLPAWWPVLLAEATVTLLAEKGQHSTVIMPSPEGSQPSSAPWPLFVARLNKLKK